MAVGVRIGGIFARRLAAQAQDRGDLTHRKALMSETVDLKDGAFVNRDLLPEGYGWICRMVAGSACAMCGALWSGLAGWHTGVSGSEST